MFERSSPGAAGAASSSTIHEQIEELAAFNCDPAGGGITREVFTPEYMAANGYVASLMERAGLTVASDSFGNLFGRLEGSEPSAPAVLSGSHIDTVLNAGRYDGVLGVLGAIEAVRGLAAGGWRPRRSVEVVCFAGEEPRFGKGCIGSRAMTGALTRSDLDSLTDIAGTTLADALRAADLDPDRLAAARIDPSGVHAFVELHIEQGIVLESAGIPVGVVTHIAAQHSMRLSLRGEAGHAGATPMRLRRDALAGAAEVIVALERLALQAASGTAVGTVGVISALPGAINVVPGTAELLVDIRDRELASRTELVDAFVAAVAAIAQRRGLEHELTTISRDVPVACSDHVVAAARTACGELGAGFTEMVSGAVHDAIIMGAQIRIGMIFVPSRGGVSHSPFEYTAPEEIDRGVAVLAGTLAILADEQ
jgi:hydantoinase/carbamoylase family amidase